MINLEDQPLPNAVVFVDDAHTFGGAQIALAWAVKAVLESHPEQEVICVTTRKTMQTILAVTTEHPKLRIIECPRALPLNILLFPLRIVRFHGILKPLLSQTDLLWWFNLADIGFDIAPLTVLRMHGKRPAAWLHNTKECSFFTRNHSLPKRALSKLRDILANDFIFRQYSRVATPGRASQSDVDARTAGQGVKTSYLYPISGFRENVRPRTADPLFHCRYDLWIIGRIEYRHKNQILALEALRCLLAYHPDSHLTIVGSGPDLDRLKEDIDRLNLNSEVTLLKWSPDPWSQMRRDAILLMPSFYEGMSLVVTEAMLLGIRIVASPIPSFQEQLPLELIAGHFTAPAFAETIRSVRELSEEKLRRLYAERLINFSPEKFVANFRRLSAPALDLHGYTAPAGKAC